jgi:hypothetical protein
LRPKNQRTRGQDEIKRKRNPNVQRVVAAKLERLRRCTANDAMEAFERVCAGTQHELVGDIAHVLDDVALYGVRLRLRERLVIAQIVRVVKAQVAALAAPVRAHVVELSERMSATKKTAKKTKTPTRARKSSAVLIVPLLMPDSTKFSERTMRSGHPLRFGSSHLRTSADACAQVNACKIKLVL